jgi:hypothetical protein
MSEKELLEAIRELAGWCRWNVYHTHDSRRSEPGFPDLVLAHKDRGVLFVELKSEKGKLTKEQTGWGAVLLAAGADWRVWRPADWSDGTIREALQGAGE